ncbi:MAG: N-acetylmuramoyl-L-alanine amidase [Alphaproteobacteria bacterium]|nr:N-acetylmuramoyl-L-alanine amidase [Alphaproteobacteria bacterium]
MKTLIELLQLLLSIFIKPKEPQVTQVPQVPVVESVTASEPVQEPIVDKPIPKPTIYTGWLKSAIRKDFPASQYMQEKTNKFQIYTHHTVGGSAQSSINTWLQDPQRVCTHLIIERDGTAYQLFSLDYWGYHLYVASPGNKVDIEFKKNASRYDMHSIGIELCNFGPITVRNNRYYNLYNQSIDPDDVIKLDFRGYQYWEKYDPRQIEGLRKVLLELLEIYPQIDYTPLINTGGFELNRNALKQKSGLYSHGNVRSDKSDSAPQPELIKMLNTLNLKNG